LNRLISTITPSLLRYVKIIDIFCDQVVINVKNIRDIELMVVTINNKEEESHKTIGKQDPIPLRGKVANKYKELSTLGS